MTVGSQGHRWHHGPNSTVTLDTNLLSQPGLSSYHCSLSFCHLLISSVIFATPVPIFITQHFLQTSSSFLKPGFDTLLICSILIKINNNSDENMFTHTPFQRSCNPRPSNTFNLFKAPKFPSPAQSPPDFQTHNPAAHLLSRGPDPHFLPH